VQPERRLTQEFHHSAHGGPRRGDGDLTGQPVKELPNDDEGKADKQGVSNISQRGEQAARTSAGSVEVFSGSGCVGVHGLHDPSDTAAAAGMNAPLPEV
jgi:hypothetical protein